MRVETTREPTTMNDQIKEIITKLDLKPHPEGGYFRETYRATEEIDSHALPDPFPGNRSYSTCIYFLLTSGNFSAFHKINQDEVWHFYDGAPVELHIISPEGQHSTHIVGRDLENGQTPQLVVPAHHWFASKVLDDADYSLVGCTVAPGFDFADFTLANRNELSREFPQHKKLIESFTRDS